MGFSHGWSKMMLGVIPMSSIEVYVGFLRNFWRKLQNWKTRKTGPKRGSAEVRKTRRGRGAKNGTLHARLGESIAHLGESIAHLGEHPRRGGGCPRLGEGSVHSVQFFNFVSKSLVFVHQ